MATNSKVAIEVEIKNIKKISDLKKELKELRKEQRDYEKKVADGGKQTKKSAKEYSDSAKAIKNKSKELRGLNKQISTTTSATQKATKSTNAMAKQFVKGAAALGIIVGAFRTVSNAISTVVRTFTEFEFTMAKVLAVSGATDREFADLTATAEELGRTTFFTAEQVGQLQLAFSKLGFTAAEIQDAVKPTLDLATATGTDLARAAQVAGAAVRGFGLDASETERVVDVMAVSFSSSAMDIEKWQTGMTKVAPIAKAAGFSIEDTAAIMSKLSDSGIEASIAGTSLRNILLKMQDPTSELSMRFGRTIHSLDDLVPAMKQFIAEGGSMADIMEVVDLRQAAAFEQMLTTADGTLKLRDELRNANGEGARMAELVGDTLQGAFLKLKSALQGVSISLMKGFAEGMQSAIEQAASFFNMIAENSKTITNTIKFLGKLVKIIGLYKLGVVAATTATRLYAKSQVLLRFAMIKTTGATMTLTGAFTALRVAAKSAMSASGVGLVLVGLSELIPRLIKTKEKTEELTTETEKLTKGYYESLKPIEQLTVTSKELVRVKGLMNKMVTDGLIVLDKEGKIIKGTAANQKIYNTYKGQAAIHTRALNSELEKNDQALITEKTSIEGVAEAVDALTTSLTNQALVKGFTSQLERITDEVAAAAVAEQEIAELFGVDPSELANLFDESGNIITKSFGMLQDNAAELNAENLGLQTSLLQMGEVLEKAGISSFNELQETLTGADAKTETLTKAFDKLAGGDGIGALALSLKNLNKDLDDGENSLTQWSEKTKEALNEVKKQLLENQLSEQAYRDAVLKARKDVLEQELASLDDTETNAKRILQIQTELLDIGVQARKNAINKSLKAEQDRYNKEKENIIAANTINGRLTEQGQELLLKSEITFLENKRKLYETYAMDVIGLDTQIATSNRNLQQQQMAMFRAEISEMGSLGSAMQSLAGDNEKLNFVKEAGIKISQVATTVEAALRIEESLRTLGIIKQNAAKATDVVITKTQTGSNLKEAASENVSTASTIAGTVADIASIIPKAISAVLSSFKGLGPFGLIAAIAAFAFVRKLVRWKGERGGIIQSDEKFANGGMVQGKSHAQGGEKFAVGGRVVELEGGEAVINKKSTAMYRSQLSAINEAGGGVKFADGGLLNNPQFANQQFSAGMTNSGMQKVFVVESDITSSQRKVNVLESQATI